jgi:hypothetical protein
VDSPVQVNRGARELRRLLREQTFDLRGLDISGFRRWLDCHLSRWQNDPVFQQRIRIRDLRRAHPQLRVLEQQHRRAAALDAQSPQFTRLQRVEKELTDAARAIAGLTAALQQATPEKQATLREKLTAFQARQTALQDERAALIVSSPQRRLLLGLAAELQHLRATTGLDGEEAQLERLSKQHGHHTGGRGAAFEKLALDITRDHILPDLLRGRGTGSAERLRVLSGVTLGAARTELDQVVIRLPRRSGEPVEVLAVVEAKRNPNDLAHGFRMRQENLAWLTGASAGYDPQSYRTSYFTAGHFDREAVHEEGGETFRFARRSFGRFRCDADKGPILDRLYLITRAGTLWGASTAALGRISFRIATDDRWQPESDHYLGELLSWCASLTEPIEAPDVFRSYLAAPRRARQILVASG